MQLNALAVLLFAVQLTITLASIGPPSSCCYRTRDMKVQVTKIVSYMRQPTSLCAVRAVKQWMATTLASEFRKSQFSCFLCFVCRGVEYLVVELQREKTVYSCINTIIRIKRIGPRPDCGVRTRKVIMPVTQIMG
ncbi:hypothetical protein SRHO_G00018540 [Serrasalmus rhombeus]